MGILVFGVLTGIIAAGGALIIGQPFLIALACYIGGGLLGAMVGLALKLRTPTHKTEQTAIAQPHLN